MPTLGAKNGLTLASMIGKDFDDPQWETLLDQLTFDEMVNTITLASTTLQQLPPSARLLPRTRTALRV